MLNAALKSYHTGDEVRPRPRVVLCGDCRSDETSTAWRELLTFVPESDCSRVNDLPELRQWLEREDPPDLFLFVQTWSDEFHFVDLLSLPGIGPLSRLVFCYGPWCISDGRSRPDFPPAVRVPIEHLRLVLRREFQPDAGTASPAYPLPWTASRDEIFRERWPELPAEASAATRKRTIHLTSYDRELVRLWNDVFTRAGYLTTTGTDYQPDQIVIWDVDVWSPAIGARWADCRNRATPLPIVAMTGFATPNTTAEMLAAGATKVLSKLLPLHELLAEIATVDNR